MKKQGKTSFVIHITIMVMCIVLFVSAVVSIVLFNNLRNISFRHVMETARDTVDRKQNDVLTMLKEHTNLVEAVAVSLAVIFETDENIPRERLESFFIEARKNYPNSTFLYYSNNIKWNEPGGMLAFSHRWVPDDPVYDQTTRPWFTAAKKAGGNIAYTDPFIAASTGTLTVAISKIVYDSGGQDIGVVCLEITVSAMDSLLESNWEFLQSYILDRNGLFITNADGSAVMNKNFFDEIGFASYRDQILSSNSFNVEDKEYLLYSELIPGADWVLITLVSRNMIFAEANSLLFRMIIMIIVMLLLASGLMALFIYRMLTVPIKEMLQVTALLAQMDFTVNISKFRKDEIGDIQRALIEIRDSLKRGIVSLQEHNEASKRFVPTQFMKIIGVDNITKLKLGDSVQSIITVMFFDIRAFSVYSQMMSTHENFDFVNKVFGLSGAIIKKHNGFVDKYLGDAAMILFERAVDSVRAGIEIYRALILDKSTRISNGMDGINIGIGAHTGNVMMGVIGDTEHYASTVISKHVNTASRIEGLTKQTKAGMLISADVMHSIPDYEQDFDSRYLGLINPASSRETIGIFEILDVLPDNTRKLRLKTKKVFESAVRNFHTENYRASAERFKKVFEFDTADECAKLFYEKAVACLEGRERRNVFSFNTK